MYKIPEPGNGKQELRKRMQDGGISVSTGCVWEEHAENLEEMLKTADSYMYVEKEAYHREMVTVTEHNGV